MTRLAALTGLAAEAAILRQAAEAEGSSMEVAAAGLEPDDARAAMARLMGQQPQGLISFGFAGGLSPELQAGELVVPEAVRACDGSQMKVDPALRHRLLAAIVDPVRQGTVASVHAPVATAAAKAKIRAETGAAIVDMESEIVARAAAVAGLPFLVVRAVSDPAHRSVPDAFLKLLDREGRLRWTALPAVFTHPLAAIRLWRDSRRAMAALRWAAAALCRSLRGAD